MNTMLEELRAEAVETKQSLLSTIVRKTTELWNDIKVKRGIERFKDDVEYQIKAKERQIEDLEDKKINSVKSADFTTTENRLKFLKTIDDIDSDIEATYDAIERLKKFQSEYLD